jgi:hypothetical protein
MYKKFDLEAAKNGAPVITRDGRPARIICFDRKHNLNNIVALIENSEGVEVALLFYSGGEYYSDIESDNDLFIAPVKKNGWINIYPPGSVNASAYCSEAYVSKAMAEHYAVKDRVTCLEIEWLE